MRRLLLLSLFGALSVGCPRGDGSTDATRAARAGLDLDTRAAAEVVAASAADLDVGLRGPALGRLIEISSAPGGGDWGQRAVWDPSPWVQREAIHGLEARLPEQESAELLLQLALRQEAEPYTRGLAALALADQGDRRPLEAMQVCMNVDVLWRAAPCALAAARYNDPSGKERLLVALDAQELPLDLAFVAALGGSGLEFLVPELEGALSWVEEPLRVPVAAALLELSPQRGESAMRGYLGDPSIEVRLEALDFLRDRDQPEATALISKASTSSEVDGQYARLIEVARGGRAPAAALEAFSSPNREVRAWSVWALGRSWSPELPKKERADISAALVAAAADTESTVRLEAARALGASGADAELQALEALLESELPQVRLEAGLRLLQLARGS